MTTTSPVTGATDDREYLYAELAANNRLSETLHNEPNRTFVSDWNGENPFVRQFLDDFADVTISRLGDLEKYSRMDSDSDLAAAVADLHVQRYGEPSVTPTRCVLGAGATGFLTTLLMYQYLNGARELAYLPPIHSGATWWIRKLGFVVRRVATDVDFSPRGELTLPENRCVLWLTDPVWFAGVPIRMETLEAIAAWQRRTGSTIIVDGTFQYMSWDGAGSEATERLDPDLTFRLVCPTKALSLHGFRFAYAIVPEQHSAPFAELHGRLHGPAGLPDRRFAHRAVTTLRSGEGALPLLHLARGSYRELISRRAVTAAVEPKGGYFLFGCPAVARERFMGMDINCFGGTGYPGFVRINLLNKAAIDCLLEMPGRAVTT